MLKAMELAGGTTTALAKAANISQNAVWKLLRGFSKKAEFETAVKLEKATGGVISRIEFMTPFISSADYQQTEIEKTTRQ